MILSGRATGSFIGAELGKRGNCFQSICQMECRLIWMRWRRLNATTKNMYIYSIFLTFLVEKSFRTTPRQPHTPDTLLVSSSSTHFGNVFAVTARISNKEGNTIQKINYSNVGLEMLSYNVHTSRFSPISSELYGICNCISVKHVNQKCPTYMPNEYIIVPFYDQRS